jgi:hypothetical protein
LNAASGKVTCEPTYKFVRASVDNAVLIVMHITLIVNIFGKETGVRYAKAFERRT